MSNIPLFLIIVFFLLPFSGCIKTATPLWASKISPTPPPPGSEEIIRLSDEEKISLRQLLEDLHEVRVIFIGESHDQMEHHHIQRRIIRELAVKGKEVVVAMEMFQKSQQPVLDLWSQGLLTEEEFLQQVKWEAIWGMDYQLYKGILDEARDNRLKVLGINVPRELVRKVAQSGIGGLSIEDRKELPEMDLTDQQHRAYIEFVYKGHEGGLARDFEKFYQAQVLWDEGMAENLSQYLSSPEGQGKTAIVLTGNGHIVYHFGIPKRFYRRIPLPYKTIVLREWRIGNGQELPQISLPLADYLWITHPSPLEKKRPRIGLVLKEKEESLEVWIERVIPGSPAEKAGLLPGDRILSVDGKEIKRLKDLHHAVAQKAHGKEILFTILREGLIKEVYVNWLGGSS
jgi:uncharacterized iron-regulated protein